MKNNDNILGLLRQLEIGQSQTFPAERASYVSSVCARFGFEWSKRFRTRTDKTNRTITVTRTA